MAWAVLVLTLGASSLLYLLIQRDAAAKVTNLVDLVPPRTALLAWLLFGEPLTAPTLLGTATTGGGCGAGHARTLHGPGSMKALAPLHRSWCGSWVSVRKGQAAVSDLLAPAALANFHAGKHVQTFACADHRGDASRIVRLCGAEPLWFCRILTARQAVGFNHLALIPAAAPNHCEITAGECVLSIVFGLQRRAGNEAVQIKSFLTYFRRGYT